MDYDQQIDDILQDSKDSWEALELTTITGKTWVSRGRPATGRWGEADSYRDAQDIKLEDLRKALAPSPPLPNEFDPHTDWQYNPWNATPGAVDPNSVAMIGVWSTRTYTGGWTGTRGNLFGPNLCTNNYGQAWVWGTASDPVYDVLVTRYPVGKIVKNVHIPLGTNLPPGDGHLTVLDIPTNRTIDIWAGKFEAGKWTAGSCDEFPLGGIPLPRQGSNAAGFPALAVAVWPEEIAAGKINHALGFSVIRAATKPSNYRYPATKCDGIGLADDMPEGAHLSLPPELTPDSTWKPWVKPVFVALQEHGMYCMDQGGSLGICGIDPRNGGMKWSETGKQTGSDTDGYISFPGNFPWKSMRVHVPPPQS